MKNSVDDRAPSGHWTGQLRNSSRELPPPNDGALLKLVALIHLLQDLCFIFIGFEL